MEIIFRADGDSATGLGHVMRSSALMQMLQDEYTCRFFTKDISFFPFKDFAKEPQVVHFDHELSEEAALLQKVSHSASLIVLDGYKFNTAYQQQLKNAGFKIVCIDDIISYHFVADLVINHAGGISAKDYSAEPFTRFCLGPAYALVKPVFQSSCFVNKDIERKVLLISLGGADPDNITEQILDSSAIDGFSKIHVILGAANLNAAYIKRHFRGNAQVNIHHNITSLEMHSLMNDSSYAILTPSTVCYEYMCTTGVVHLYKIADNQENIRKYFIEEQLAFDITEIGKVPASQMRSSIRKQKTIFDGKSQERLQREFSLLKKRVPA